VARVSFEDFKSLVAEVELHRASRLIDLVRRSGDDEDLARARQARGILQADAEAPAAEEGRASLAPYEPLKEFDKRKLGRFALPHYSCNAC
jgi:hypothetical protein